MTELHPEVDSYGNDKFAVLRRVPGAPKLTVITCTYQRPQAFRLCEKYMARQTRQPDQWLVLDGPEPMREKVLAAFRDGKVEGDYAAVVEDDDFYRANWLEWCCGLLDRYDIVGQGNALYYNVARRWWNPCLNTRHASLCQTAIRKEMYEPVMNIIAGFDNQFFDTRIWRLSCNRYLHLPKTDAERLVIGMKGLTGTKGYSLEHKAIIPPNVHLDPALLKLWQLLGPDAANYSSFYQR